MADGGKIEFETDEESYEYEGEGEGEGTEDSEISETQELDWEYSAEYSSIARKPEDGTVFENILEFLYPS